MSSADPSSVAGVSGRRSFMAAAAAAMAAAGTVRADEYAPDAAPVRYPDHRLVELDKRFAKLKLGNTPIQRLYHSKNMMWAEGPAWNGSGRYLVWSDIPNNLQHRWL
ncbi:MAG: SMP-30/gluconolactonase/LRE family protein, partial [Planctomycetaceae bacterium]